jgi:UrcA family protein
MAKSDKWKQVAMAAATFIFASSASAGERQRSVDHNDLDLSTQMGQATLKKRVNSAVIGVCAFPSAKTAAERNDQKRCEARARTSAMRQAAEKIARNGTSIKVAFD